MRGYALVLSVPVLACGIGLRGSAVFAQEAVTVNRVAPSSYQVNDVSLGPFGNQSVLDLPYSIQSVDSSLARNQQYISVQEAFRLIPSVQGGNIRPQTRGLQAGVVQNTRIDDLNIAATTDYPIEEFQRIDVLDGVSGALYGPANPAGTFDYVLKRPTSQPLRDFTAEYLSQQSFLYQADLGGLAGRDGLFGYRINLVSQNGEDFADHSRLKRQLASLGFDIHLAPGTTIESDASVYRYIDTGLPGTFAVAKGVDFPEGLDPGRVGYGQIYGGDDNLTTFLTSRLKHDFSPQWHLNSGLLYETNNRASTVPPNTITDAAGDTTTTAATTTFSVDTILSNNLTLNGRVKILGLTQDLLFSENGFDWNRYTPFKTGPITLGHASLADPKLFPEPRFPDFSQRYHAMNTLQQSLTFGDVVELTRQVSVIGIASQSWIQAQNYGSTGRTTSDYDADGISPTASLLYKPFARTLAYVTYSNSLQQGDSAPAGSSNVGASLPPYRTEQWEIGYKLDVRGIDFTSAAYRIQRPYAYVGSNNLFAIQGRQVNRGIELNASGDVGRPFTVFGGISLLDPRLLDTGSVTTSDKQILGLSHVTFDLLIEYHPFFVPGLTLSANVNLVSRRPGDYSDSDYVDGYTVTDVNLRYPVSVAGKHVLLRVSVDNVTDGRYWANIAPTGQNGYEGTNSGTGTLGAPRTFRASLEVNL